MMPARRPPGLEDQPSIGALCALPDAAASLATKRAVVGEIKVASLPRTRTHVEIPRNDMSFEYVTYIAREPNLRCSFR
jgi:hypothetical protein